MTAPVVVETRLPSAGLLPGHFGQEQPSPGNTATDCDERSGDQDIGNGTAWQP